MGIIQRSLTNREKKLLDHVLRPTCRLSELLGEVALARGSYFHNRTRRSHLRLPRASPTPRHIRTLSSNANIRSHNTHIVWSLWWRANLSVQASKHTRFP